MKGPLWVCEGGAVVLALCQGAFQGGVLGFGTVLLSPPEPASDIPREERLLTPPPTPFGPWGVRSAPQWEGKQKLWEGKDEEGPQWPK